MDQGNGVAVPLFLSVAPRPLSLGHDVLRHFIREHVQMIRDAFRVLGLLEVPRGSRAELEAGGQALEAEHILEREERTRFRFGDHSRGRRSVLSDGSGRGSRSADAEHVAVRITHFQLRHAGAHW
jgi:hypothetical protein